MDFLEPRYVPMNRRRRIYEGKAKILFEGPEPGTLVQFFKDDATAFNKKKHEVVDGKYRRLRAQLLGVIAQLAFRARRELQ